MHVAPDATALADRIETALVKGRTLARGVFVELDEERIRGAARDSGVGPLAGRLVSLKDLFDETGVRTMAGSSLLADSAPAADDATVIARLKSAGAVPFGRTGMSEFAYSGVGLNPHHGTPGNAIDPTRIPGGSSSGAALSVAHGVCDAAVGTDTGGSVRIPAAANGIVGIKPSANLVPMDGVLPLSPSFDSVGPLAPGLDDAVRVFEVIAARAFPHDPVDAPVLGLPDGAFLDGLDAPVRTAWAHLLERLEAAGLEMRTVRLDFLAEALPLARTIIAADAFATYGPRMDELSIVGDPRVRARIAHGGTLDAEMVARARDDRRVVVERFARALENIDVLLAPTIAISPPTIAVAEAEFDRVNAAMLRNTTLINIADGCAVTLPFAVPDATMPGAVMLCAPNGRDSRLLAVATRVETLLARVRA